MNLRADQPAGLVATTKRASLTARSERRDCFGDPGVAASIADRPGQAAMSCRISATWSGAENIAQ
jgi:hypothetical protein